jgi:oligopeptide/dipeptide ABC transporter ATP-binding protein
MADTAPLLEIRDLRVGFQTEAGFLRAVDGVNLQLHPGRTLGVVGESGCGKSVTALSVMRLVPQPPGKMVGGEILWKGNDLLQLPASDMPAIRGREISMIFQDPMTSLNPVYTIERQMGEVLKLRFGMNKIESREKSAEMLQRVGISEAETRLRSYPHELSGGMKQRIMIAMALLCEPDLLIADEPTTALDVTIQAQILYLMKQLQQEFHTSIMLITHDMGVVAETCDDMAVMYAGRVVEQGPVREIFRAPQHPYTRGLLDSIPRPGHSRDEPLATIEGVVPSLFEPPPGCRFADRCAHRKSLDESKRDECVSNDPLLQKAESADRHVACLFPLNN